MDALTAWQGFLAGGGPPLWAGRWPDAQLHAAMREGRVVGLGTRPGGGGAIERVADPAAWDRGRLPELAAFDDPLPDFPALACPADDWGRLVATVRGSETSTPEVQVFELPVAGVACPACGGPTRTFRWKDVRRLDWVAADRTNCADPNCDWPGTTDPFADGGSLDNDGGY